LRFGLFSIPESALGYIGGLRLFFSFNDLELNVITLLQAPESFPGDGTVMDEDIRSTLLAEKTKAPCIVEPLDDAFQSRLGAPSGETRKSAAIVMSSSRKKGPCCVSSLSR